MVGPPRIIHVRLPQTGISFNNQGVLESTCLLSSLSSTRSQSRHTGRKIYVEFVVQKSFHQKRLQYFMQISLFILFGKLEIL